LEDFMLILRAIDDAFVQVNWVQGSAFDESLLKNEILPNVDCVVHTLGILFEEDYKSNGIQSLAKVIKDNFRDRLLGSSARGSKRGSPSSTLLGTFLQDNSRNPLAARKDVSFQSDSFAASSNTSRNNSSEEGPYERINRDSALTVLRAFLESRPTSSSSTNSIPTNPFIYVSAEDIFRPFVPDRYISTKREAEWEILRMADTARSLLELSEQSPGENEGEDMEKPTRLVRPVLVRPGACIVNFNFQGDFFMNATTFWITANRYMLISGLMFDYDTRPITKLPTSLLKLSTAIQETLPSPLKAQTLSMLFSSVADSYISRQDGTSVPPNHASLANLLSTPPLHVDVVAETITRAIEVDHIEGVLDVQDMRSMVEGKGTGDHKHTSQSFA